MIRRFSGWVTTIALLQGLGAVAQTPEQVASMLAACEAGQAAQCVDAGVAVEKGQWADVDLARAAALQLRACELGNGIGCANHGSMLRFGRGVAQDKVAALAFYLKGCELRSGFACSVSAAQYQSTVAERLGPADGAKVLALYERGCELGFAPSCRYAASALFLGTTDGVAVDKARSTALDEAGCQKGGAESCHWAALSYLHGNGVAVDWQKQINLAGRGCSLKFAMACDLAGLAHRNRPTPPPEGKWTDMVRASRFFRTGCELGAASACVNLAAHLWNGQGFTTKLPNLAIHLLAKACAMKFEFGCKSHSERSAGFKPVEAIDPFLPPAQQYLLGEAALSGPHARVGVEALLYAAELGQVNAMYLAGRLYESGYPGIVKVSPWEAENWWDKARKAGHADAAWAYAQTRIEYFRTQSQRPEAHMDAIRALNRAVELGSTQALAYRDQWRAASNETARLIGERLEAMNRQNREARGALDQQTVARAWQQFARAQADAQGERVCALIYEGQRTHQECMSKDHFRRFYTPGGG